MINNDSTTLPLFSIITISFNNALGLAKTLESIKIQKEKDYELILIDGGSTDDTKKVIERYKDIITYSVSEKDRGIAHAFNKGTQVARGKIVNYLNSGDIYLNENVLTVVKESYLKYRWEWAYGLRKRIDKFDNIYEARTSELISYSFKYLVDSKLIISHQATFFNLNILNDIGLYDEQYQYLVMDYDLMLRFGKKYQPKELNIYLILYEDFGLSANYFFKSLKLKHLSRVKNYYIDSKDIYIDLIKTYMLYLVGKSRSYIKKLLLMSNFGKRRLNIK